MQASSPSFITEIPLKIGSYERSILKKRFWAAKQQYNALLGECLDRLEQVKKDERFKKANELYRDKETRAEAKSLFKQLNIDHQYREYDLYSYCIQWNKKKSPLSIGSRISQKLAKRVFLSVEKYRTLKQNPKEYKKYKGKPRFKGYRGLTSIEDNSIDANLRLRNGLIQYLGINLRLEYNLTDPIHYHSKTSKVKYIRLVKRQFNKKIHYFAQLVSEGKPLIKSQNISKEGVIGLDIGPQTIAIVSKEAPFASISSFADELKEQKVLKQKYQRKQSRQLRSCNPDSYEKDVWGKKDKYFKRKHGKNIKGKSLRNRSKSLKKTHLKLNELCRRESATRKTLHGELVNKILREGHIVKTEKISYKWFQSLHGKSVGLRAPGMFVEILKRKAENAGGKVEEVNTITTKLSQSCHCGKVRKKTLKERWHKCICGTICQRDLYSAYLVCYVEKNKLIADQAKANWSGKDLVLSAAMRKLKQSSRGKSFPSSLGLGNMPILGSEIVAC